MTPTSAHPRVLIVGQPFTRTSGGGITLCNLFEGWPKDRLASVAVSGRSLDPDACDLTYVLGRDEIVWKWPLSLVTRTETAASGPQKPAAPPTAAAVGEDTVEPSLRRTFRATIDGLGVGDALRVMHLSDGLLDWIRAFRPDIVYSQLSDLPVMTLVTEILDATGVPFALHIMDDWPASMYRHGILAPFVHRRAESRMTALFERATARLAISDAMAQEYETRFGRPFVGVHNPVDLPRWDALAAREPDAPAGIAAQMRVMYAGRVGRANANSIADVADAVAGLAAAGATIGMDIYTGDWSRPDVARLGDLAGVRAHPGVAYERIPALMRAADVLLLPLDFDAEAAGFARLSMPTKVSEYLASGRPVLTYAPAGSAATEYARTGGWSLVIDRRDPSALRDALAMLADGPALRQEMGARARRCAELNHDASRVREQFRAALSGGAGPPQS